LPKPLIDEQRRISHVLTTVQNVIAQQERLITLTTELKRVLMHKLFTEGLHGEKQKPTEIGLIPENWDVVKIGDIFKFSSGKTRPSELEEIPTKEKPYPVYGGNGIMGYSSDYLLELPTLLLGRVGEYCGCAHHTNGRAWISDNALYAKEIKNEINTVFAVEYFNYADLNQYSNKAGQPLITQGVISAVLMPLPKKEEQDTMSEHFKLLNEKSVLLRRKKSSLEELFRTLLHQLMTAQIRVNNLEI
jgi:type I restriction enzyme S subunit